MSSTVKAVALTTPMEDVELPIIYAGYTKTLTHVGIGRINVETCWDSCAENGYCEVWTCYCYLQDSKLIKAPGQGLYVKLEGDEFSTLKAKVTTGGIAVCCELLEAILETLQTHGYVGAGSIVSVETG